MVTSMLQVEEKLRTVNPHQGEGLIFRKPGSKYLDRDSLFKKVV